MLTRTNITIPSELLDQIDEIVGPRGRSRYIAEALRRQIRGDRQRKAFEESFGVLVGTPAWMDSDQALAFARKLRSAWDE